MPDPFSVQTYDKMIVRAASIMQTTDMDGTYSTNLAEVKLGEKNMHFLQDPATLQYRFVCPHDSRFAIDDLEKAEARAHIIQDRAQIQSFLDAVNVCDNKGLSKIISDIVQKLEDARLKGKAY